MTLKEELIGKIEAAFKDVKRQDGVTFHQAIARDDRASEKEELEARKLDRDEYWQDVPDELLKNEGSFLTFLDDKGLRYYLPASMRCALRHSDESSYLIESILYRFFPISRKQGKPSDFVSNFVKNLQLTKEQCQVIYQFMKYFEDEYLQVDELWLKSLEEWKKLSE